MKPPTLNDIQAAHQRIKTVVHQTPVLTSTTFNRWTGREIYFKCENLQKTGAFKLRGACNAVFNLPDKDGQCGVATHSSGNHAAALAFAAHNRGIPAYVVMPKNTSANKIAAVRSYGGQITFCEPTLAAREQTLEQLLQKTGAAFIHPYDNADVIAGQGTACMELIGEIPFLDTVLVPIGGGGLTSGSAIAAKSMNPSIKVIACEPELADDAYQSFHRGEIIHCETTRTIADGLRTHLSPLTFSIVRELVDDILLVTEKQIIEAMQTILERMKTVIEPSSAVPFAALMAHPDRIPGKHIGLILSGGNIDLKNLPW